VVALLGCKGQTFCNSLEGLKAKIKIQEAIHGFKKYQRLTYLLIMPYPFISPTAQTIYCKYHD
jgi:hypothetical protein